MKKALLLGLLFATTAFGARAVPPTITLPSYSVTLKVPDDLWTAEVFDKTEVIRYFSVDDPIRKGVVFCLTVFRVKLPDDKVRLETGELVKHLVRDDALRFKTKEFGRSFNFRFQPDRLEVPAGMAYIYHDDSPVFHDGVGHYAAVGLLLPSDYRARTIGYLVVGHQVGRRAVVDQEQLEYLKLILLGLKELNPAPGPSRPQASDQRPH